MLLFRDNPNLCIGLFVNDEISTAINCICTEWMSDSPIFYVCYSSSHHHHHFTNVCIFLYFLWCTLCTISIIIIIINYSVLSVSESYYWASTTSWQHTKGRERADFLWPLLDLSAEATMDNRRSTIINYFSNIHIHFWLPTMGDINKFVRNAITTTTTTTTTKSFVSWHLLFKLWWLRVVQGCASFLSRGP